MVVLRRCCVFGQRGKASVSIRDVGIVLLRALESGERWSLLLCISSRGSYRRTRTERSSRGSSTVLICTDSARYQNALSKNEPIFRIRLLLTPMYISWPYTDITDETAWNLSAGRASACRLRRLSRAAQAEASIPCRRVSLCFIKPHFSANELIVCASLPFSGSVNKRRLGQVSSGQPVSTHVYLLAARKAVVQVLPVEMLPNRVFRFLAFDKITSMHSFPTTTSLY